MAAARSDAQAHRREQLAEKIQRVHQESKERYGAPRIHVELTAQGTPVSKNTVAKLMREYGIRSKMRRRFAVGTTDSRHEHPVANNRLNQQFERRATNQAWAADITCIPTAEGWMYLAAVIDLCSRKIVGWATADHLRAELPAARCAWRCCNEIRRKACCTTAIVACNTRVMTTSDC